MGVPNDAIHKDLIVYAFSSFKSAPDKMKALVECHRKLPKVDSRFVKFIKFAKFQKTSQKEGSKSIIKTQKMSRTKLITSCTGQNRGVLLQYEKAKEFKVGD